jgi:hypothetical protein
MQRLTNKNSALVPSVETLAPGQIGGIIMLPALADLDLPPSGWFDSEAWQEVNFTEPYYTFSPQILGYTQAGERSYTLLMPGQPLSTFPTTHPLIKISSSLTGQVGVIPWLKIPYWGIDPGVPGSPISLFLGDGDTFGLKAMVWSAKVQRVFLQTVITPGPSRTDSQRTVELNHRGNDIDATQTKKFDGLTLLTFPLILQPGRNDFHFTILDKPTVSTLANGDTRPLLARLRQEITIASLADLNQAGPNSTPLLLVNTSLSNKVGILEMQTPPWGIENSENKSWLWLGHGEAEGIEGMLWSEEKQQVRVTFKVSPGPARSDNQRTLQLTLINTAGTQTTQQRFEQPSTLSFTTTLQPGRNSFYFSALDEPTILQQPNGDKRPLLVLLQSITMTDLSSQ